MTERKRIEWMGSSKEDLLDLPRKIQRMIGYSLNLAQQGKNDPDSEILTGFGCASVREIKKDDRGGTYRAVYTLQFKDAIYVLHVFQKKSKSGKATPKEDMELIRKRLRDAKAIWAKD